MNRVEVLMARRQVNALILADPVMITPARKTQIDTGDGGWKWGPSTPQGQVQVAIVPAKRRLSEFLVNTELGKVVDYPFILLGRHTADIQKDDTFTWQGDQYQVKSIYIKTEVSLTAQIDYFGGTTNG